ncbi:MAG: OadG family protein [Lachnospiraceae bacterium]|nr:OadG family protein [Lachnospiraceae bacterium]MBQ2251273.1 OadG family protein [Lachnospiraceae bacterium]MBQ2425323.1 OadG family protein [Lachnospiraceae bacterium]MBQ5599784.1 OadG family protein [Lachnospiraceae bacterium]MBQ5659827.1 OadG family protein [Lachnospiraceae bacterium]
MWTGQTMTFMDSVVISLLGILVVFTCLACIAISIVIISKVINAIIKPEAPKAAVAAAAAPAPAIDEEAYAVLVAAVTEEARLSGDGDVRVVSIKEL